MGIFLVYILKSSLCLAAFYLFYRLLLSRETLHRFNRMALLGVLLLSAVVPLIEVSTEQPTGVGQGMLTLEEWLVLSEAMPEVSSTPVEEARAVWPLVLLAVYGVGVLFFLGRNLLSLIRLGQLLRGTRREDIHRYVADAPRILLFVHERGIAPFSWMRCIVIARKDLEEDGRPILLHELAHIRCGHSWDLLLADLCCFVQWFNPAAWLLKQELQAVHEYEADEAVLRAGVNAREYQLLLIKKAVGTRLYSMANSLNHSKLKKRITMMQRRKSNPWARAKLLYVLPLAAVAVAAFARPEVSGVSNELSAAKVTDLAEIVKAGNVKSAVEPQDTVKADGLQGKNSTVYDMVEQAPAFPGGPQAMMQFIKDNLKYPQIAKENGIQGRVILQFVVDETGQVTDPKVLRSIDPSLDLEAIRIVKAMPRWTPGMQDGKAVSVRYTLPVAFSLDGDKAPATPVTATATPSDKVLWVLDGKEMPFEEFFKISGTDIESVRFLKGQQAIDKYGERGKYGVLEATSKAVKTGEKADTLYLSIGGEDVTTLEQLGALSPDKVVHIMTRRDQLGAKSKDGEVAIGVSPVESPLGKWVTGSVADSQGKPIAGAVVRIVDSERKAIQTDADGNFFFCAPEDSELEVSSNGYQTARVKAQPKVMVRLKAE